MRVRVASGIVVFAAAGALALSACGSSSSDSGSGSSGGLGGSSSAGSGGSGATVKIGFEGPLSGDNAQLGINEANGAEIAVEQANKDTSLGFKVELVKSDDGGDPAKSPAAATKLVDDAKILGVVGPSFSGSTLAVGKRYSAANLGFVTPSASNATLQNQNFSTFFRVIPNDNVEGAQGADWLAKRGVKNLFVLQDQSPYGQGVGDTVTKQAKAKGLKVTEEGLDGTQTKNYNPIAQTITASGADAVFYAGYDAQAALLAKALQSAGFKGLEVTGNGGKSSVFTKGAGGAGNGWYFTCGCQDATVAADSKAFAAEYQAKFNTPPSTYSPEAFDATKLLIQAIKDAGGASATRAGVVSKLKTANFTGITAPIKFQSNGDLDANGQVVNLYQQTNGEIKVLGNIKEQK